jgi:tetratricopeptide (TPR) repeat protein
MKKTDRIVLYLFLILLLFSPLFFRAASVYLNTSSSARMKGIVEVNESKDSRYAITALKGREEYPSAFSYALALKREGKYTEAAEVYKWLLQRRPDPRVYVNLGNSYVGMRDLDSAKGYYLKAAEIAPLPSAYYNQSQVARELLDFQRGNEYFKQALDVNREAVANYRAIYSRHPNRIVVDETLGFSELWRFAWGHSAEISTFGASVLPAPVLSVAAIFLLFLHFYMLRSVTDKAYRCKRCSGIFCPGCEKRITWGNMCHACYASLIKLDELDVKERVARLLSIHQHQKKRRTVMKLLSFLLPGISQIYAGRVLTGFLFLWPFLFFLFLPVTNAFCAGGGILYPHGFFSWMSFFFAAVIYLVTNILTRRRISKGWH